MARSVLCAVTLYRSQIGLILGLQPLLADGVTAAGPLITAGFVEEGGGVYLFSGDVPDATAFLRWTNVGAAGALLYTEALDNVGGGATTDAIIAALDAAGYLRRDEPVVLPESPPPGYGGGEGGFVGIRTIRLRLRDANDAPVAGAFFEVEGMGSGIFGPDGEVEIALNDGAYTVRVSPASGVLFDPTEIEVGEETTEFTLAGTSVQTPAPAPWPDACVVFVELEGAKGTETGTLRLLALPTYLPADGRWIVGETLTANVDGTGRLIFPGVPRGATAKVIVSAANLQSKFVVPDAETHRVATGEPLRKEV